MPKAEEAAPAAPARQWRHRARVVEAAALLMLARLLVAAVPFNRWQALLGRRCAAGADPGRALPAGMALAARRIGRAVESAARQLPLQTRCLPRAVAAQLMLRRRAIPSDLLMGLANRGERGTPDDLHAWVRCADQTIVGQLEQYHFPVIVLRSDKCAE